MKPTIVLIKVKKEDLLKYRLICWSRSSVTFHCFIAELIGFYPKKYAIIYYKCEPNTVKKYLSITAMNNSNIIWLQ